VNSVAIHVDQQRNESCLGASEAAGVLGLDKYNPPIKIWRRHRGLDVSEKENPRLKEASEWGQILEPVIRGKYALVKRARVWVPISSYNRDGWLRCTPDGLVQDGCYPWNIGTTEFAPNGDGYGPVVAKLLQEGALGGVQCKNVSSYLEHEWRDGPPPAKEIQVRVEMAVTGLPWCDLAALIGGNHYVQFRVERDLEIEDRILTDLHAFWEMVKSGQEPTVDHTDAWRLHIAEKMPAIKEIGKPDLDDEVAMLDLKAMRRIRKSALESEKLARNNLLLRMATRGITGLRSDDTEVGTVTAYKTRGTWALRCPSHWGDDEQD
jgi:predicted phage-related endonuclease